MVDVEKIREEFPILHREVYGKPLVYLDSGATAQKPRTVIETVDRLHRELNANIHRGVHFLSEEATVLYEAARERIAAFVGAAEKEEIVFTAGATASLNTVAYAWGDAFVGAGDNILVSEMEHHSNIVPWQMLAERKGAEIRVLPFDEAGALRTDLLPSLVDERTRVVAVTQASNTLGTRPDLRTVVAAAHAVGAVVVVDGCQGVVHGGVDVRAMDCDFYAFSGHKLYGPTGIGVLYGKRELLERMPPFMGGGDMVDTVTFAKTTYAPVPLKFEAGTANFVGAIGLGEAVKFMQRFDPAEIEAHEETLLRRAIAEKSNLKGVGYDPATEIIITNGGMGALSLLFLVLLNPGDEVLIQDPQWLNYVAQVRYCGGEAVRVPTDLEHNFTMQPETIEQCITPRTKALMINSPNNPTGSVMSRADMEQIAAIAKKHDLLIIADEVYNTLLYFFFVSNLCILQDLLDFFDASLDISLLVLCSIVLSVLGKVSLFSRLFDLRSNFFSSYYF